MLKWNLLNKVSTQVLYAVTGIILARLLTPDDFGLVGAMLVFQAFANMFIDSGFSSALIQRKHPTQTDYSTVMWFNIAIAAGIYAILYASAGIIADMFGGDIRLVSMSRVMFISFILNSASIVQANRLTKRLDARPVALADITGLAAGGAVGIVIAWCAPSAWAVVWQTVTSNGVRTLMLWIQSRWVPSAVFSWTALRSYMRLGTSVLATSFLNTLFQNIYSFFVGNRAGLAPLGYYTQGDRWSKMGVMSLSQTMTSSFLPILSDVQDDPARYTRVSTKINRFALYATLPCMTLLAVTAPAIFHTLFGTKWDAAIVLFELLCLRGIFTIMTLQYNNFVLSLGRGRAVVWLEVLRDSAALIALVASLPYIAETAGGTDVTYGLRLMIYGQLGASALTWFATLIYTARITGRGAGAMLADGVPYALFSGIACAAAWWFGTVIATPWLLMIAQGLAGSTVYLLLNAVSGSQIQRDILGQFFSKKRNIMLDTSDKE